MQSELQDVEGLIDLTDHIEVLDQKTSGGFGCIYQGRHKTENFLVALKIPFLRSQGHPEDKLRKAFKEEILLWNMLRHRHVCQMLGVVYKGEDVYVASKWASLGTLSEFVNANPREEKVNLIMGVVSGVAYLHHEGYIHGDLKANNVLINKDKTPILIDFGLSKTFLNVDTSVPTTGAAAGAQRWRAPELNEGQGQPKTTATDVYAVGMIIAEVLTGDIPFGSAENSGTVGGKIAKGFRPRLTPIKSWDGQTNRPIWRVAVDAWNADPAKRPSIDSIQFMIREIGVKRGIYPSDDMPDLGLQVPGTLSFSSPPSAASSQTGHASVSTLGTSLDLSTEMSSPAIMESPNLDFIISAVKLSKNYNDQSQRICSSDMSKCIFEIWDGVMHIYAEGQPKRHLQEIHIRRDKYIVGVDPIEEPKMKFRFMIYIREGKKSDPMATQRDPHYFEVTSRDNCLDFIKAIKKASIQHYVKCTKNSHKSQLVGFGVAQAYFKGCLLQRRRIEDKVVKFVPQ